MNDEKRPEAANANSPVESSPNPAPDGAPAENPSNAAPAGGDATGGPGPEGATSPAPSQQELGIRSALETVMDPEIGLSVIDLGLIRNISIAPGRTHIQMLLTTPFCPYAPQMLADVKAAAMSVLDQETDVELLPDVWSPQMMPDPGLLGFSY